MTFEYQVIYGGHMDVDVEIRSPKDEIYSDQKSETGSHTFQTKGIG